MVIPLRCAEAIGRPDEGDARFQGGFVVALGITDVDRRFESVSFHDQADVCSFGFAGHTDTFTIFKVLRCVIAAVKALDLAVLTIADNKQRIFL